MGSAAEGFQRDFWDSAPYTLTYGIGVRMVYYRIRIRMVWYIVYVWYFKYKKTYGIGINSALNG